MNDPQTFVQLFGSAWLAVAVAVGAIMGFLSLNALVLVWAERKVSARMQRRLGPVERGPFGLLQTVVDMVKLLGKELITPKNIDKTLYFAAPIIVFTPVLATCALFPITGNYVVTDYDISIVLLLALAAFNVIGVFAAGWGSNNKYSLLGAVRSVSQNIAYEIPLILSVLSVVMMTRTLSMKEMVLAQDSIWFIVVQPVAAVIFLIAATAETNRAPFDIPEAESELIGGFHTEYSGMRFGMFFFAEYSAMVVVCALGAVLFLGGWRGPFLPDIVWFLMKVYALILVMMWFRWTFPRVRFDQLLKFAWLILVPISLLNLFVTAVVMKLL